MAFGTRSKVPDKVRASGILGRDRVVPGEDAARLWDAPLRQSNVPVPYPDALLGEFAKLNRQGGDWWLVYVNGLALRDQHARIARDIAKPLGFRSTWKWWLDPREEAWSGESSEAGYLLFDMSGRYAHKTWREQQSEIFRLGHVFARPHPAVVAEAVLSILKIRGQWRLTDWYHWSGTRDSNGYPIGVGFLNRQTGLDLDAFEEGQLHDYLRTVVVRRPVK